MLLIWVNTNLSKTQRGETKNVNRLNVWTIDNKNLHMVA